MPGCQEMPSSGPLVYWQPIKVYTLFVTVNDTRPGRKERQGRGPHLDGRGAWLGGGITQILMLSCKEPS